MGYGSFSILPIYFNPILYPSTSTFSLTLEFAILLLLLVYIFLATMSGPLDSGVQNDVKL
jgi:hypothetical protein